MIYNGFFSMTALSFDKFFDMQSFLMMVVLLLLLYEKDMFLANLDLSLFFVIYRVSLKKAGKNPLPSKKPPSLLRKVVGMY